MKLTVNRETLLDILEKVVGAVEPKSTTPILSNILLAVSDNGIVLTGTDLDTEMTAYIHNTGIEEYGKITVSAKKLLDICKALPKDSLIKLFTVNEQLMVESSRSHFELATLPADDFPVLDTLVFDSKVVLPEDQFLSHLQKTAFAMASQDVRYYLNGMLFRVKASRIEVVATDGHRLAYSSSVGSEVNPATPINIIIPRKSVQELSRLLAADCKVSIEIQLSSNHIRIQKDNFRFTSKLIDGKYPDFQAAIPQTSLNILELDRLQFKDALSRVAILSNSKFRGVLLRLTQGLLTLQSSNPDREMAEETLDIAYDGDVFEVGFNINYLLDAINHIATETVILELNDVHSSTVIKSPEDADVINVVMPVKL